MSILLTLHLFISLTAGKAPDQGLSIRDLYYRASEEERFVGEMLRQLDRVDRNEPLWIGYRGMAYMLKAKHAWNPYLKLSHFQAGRELLEKAIAREPENIELRFLRFSVQSNAPSFLGYSSNLDEDLTTILTGWPGLRDDDLKQRIRQYLIKSNYWDARIGMRLNQ